MEVTFIIYPGSWTGRRCNERRSSPSSWSDGRPPGNPNSSGEIVSLHGTETVSEFGSSPVGENVKAFGIAQTHYG